MNTLKAVNGFYYHDFALRRDVFVATDRQRTTDSFIRTAINAAQTAVGKSYSVTADTVAYYKKNGGFLPATLFEKEYACGYCVSIDGDGFSYGNAEVHKTLEDCYSLDSVDGVVFLHEHKA